MYMRVGQSNVSVITLENEKTSPLAAGNMFLLTHLEILQAGTGDKIIDDRKHIQAYCQAQLF